MPDWIDGFRLQLRSASDIAIVSHPPWWNAQRLSWLLLGVWVFSAAALTWAVVLRRTVQSQTILIREKVERAAVLEERQRIAREMHDTFQQSLAGAGHLIDDALRRINGTGHQAATPLVLARQMLRHCREESRASIMELRSHIFESLPLPEALDAVLRPTAENAGVVFESNREAHLPVIPSSHSHALLRIAQEAVNNIIQHARARTIRLTIKEVRQAVELVVIDDGCGFDPKATNAMQGHFGILGMQERAERFGGCIDISSTPGRGTVVSVTLPIQSFASDPPLIVSQT